MAAGSLDLETCENESCVRGYHVYHNIWDSAINEELPCECEVHNAMDHYAIAVIRDEVVVGHQISRICSLFLRRGGTIRVKVTGKRRYSSEE